MRKTLILLGLILALILTTWFSAQLWAQRENVLQSLRLFSDILNLVSRHYVEEIKSEDLIKSAINGMLNELDPYSQYLDAAEYRELQVKTQAKFGGIGIQIGIRDNILTVISPIEGTPAYRAGLQAGDQIIEIDGEPTEGWSVSEAVKRIRGTPGTKIKIKIRREAIREEFEVTLVREIINIKSVPYAGMVKDDIGYVRLADFSQVARPELESALDSLVREGAKKFIFDLRGNSGGLLQEGFEVSNLFLPTGRTVVSVKGRDPRNNRDFVTKEDGKYLSQPLVLLVDRGSASASEIVAGCLQDWERAFVIGETTFGKGSVQTIHPLDESTALKLTTAYWFTPAGRSIHRPVKRDTIKEKTAKGYRTLGRLKREIYGKGGIAPDLYLPYPLLPKFIAKAGREIFFDFAVRYKAKHKELKKPISVTPELLQEFQNFLQQKKIDFTSAEFDSAREIITQEIEREIAAKLEGAKGEYEVRLAYDPHIKKAVELLSLAQRQEDLFEK
ncbi:MAG: S41 family peptidase [candidate division WOR-3 bacterium]